MGPAAQSAKLVEGDMGVVGAFGLQISFGGQPHQVGISLLILNKKSNGPVRVFPLIAAKSRGVIVEPKVERQGAPRYGLNTSF